MDKSSFRKFDMRTAEYQETILEIKRCSRLCWRINQSEPMTAEYRTLLNQLLSEPLDDSSNIYSPVQIDMGKYVRIGKRVFINNNLICMARGGVEIEDDVMIGPGVSLLTANHELDDHWTLLCAPICIRENAWIGARAIILPGVTVGKNSVVAAGAVVTKDVEAYTVVGGNPAHVLRLIERVE